MSYINLKKTDRYGSTSRGLDASAVKTALASASTYSSESASILETMKSGDRLDLDLGSIANHLSESLESGNDKAALGQFNNPAGMAIASFLVASAGQSPRDYLQLCVSNEAKSLNGSRVANAYGVEFENAYTTESFDNQNLLENMNISIGLNYRIARQTPAMEMVYRTIPLTPETGGLDIEVPNLYVMNTLRHPENGDEADFGLRRVIDSAIDFTVLNDQSTQMLPTHNTTTADKFVSTSIVTPFEVTVGRRTVLTSALLVGKSINLFGLSQHDSMSRVGQADYTEALDRNVGIDSVFMTLGSETIRWETKGLPYSRFYKSVEQGGRAMKLDFELSSLVIDKDTVAYNDDPLTGSAFAAIQNGNYRVRLKTVLNGTLDVERGNISINPGQVEVMYILNEAGAQIPLTSGAGATIVAGLANLTTTGWWPDARLTNSNHRHLGLMLNVRPIKERLLTRTRSPFFVPYPLSEDRDQTVMDWLTFTVGSYMNNEAVGNLIGYHERMMRLTGGLRGELTPGDFELNALPVEGIARYLINPYVQELDVDLLSSQALETTSKVENGRETLINSLRSVAFDILQRTNYENAARFMDGGEISRKWRFGLVTSRKIETFMSVAGDSRTLGANLPFQIESDVDARLADSIYMVIVRDGDGVDVLSSGVMLLTPTLVSTISVTRDNAPRNEAVVQPRFQHYHLCPIIVKLNVSGVDELLNELLPYKTKSVAGSVVGVEGKVVTEPAEPVGP